MLKLFVNLLVGKSIKRSTHVLGDKKVFVVSSEGPSSGIRRGDGESTCTFIRVNIQLHISLNTFSYFTQPPYHRIETYSEG